jgi:mRNA interferase HigB
MKVHLIKKQSVLLYVKSHARSGVSFEGWLEKIKYADWKEPMDIGHTFATSDLLGKSSHRVVFDIGGNKYRIICKYIFGETCVHLFVCWIGTHDAYTQICKRGLQFTIKSY